MGQTTDSDLLDKLTKASLKRMVKVVELQKAYLKRQKRLHKIYNLYYKLLQIWRQESERLARAEKEFVMDKFVKSQETLTSLLTQQNIADDVIDVSGCKTRVPDELLVESNRSGLDYTGDVLSMKEKDKIIFDIANASRDSSSKLEKETESVHTKPSSGEQSSDDDNAEVLKGDMNSKNTELSVWESFRNGINSLHRYLQEYFRNPALMRTDLANEERITEGYRFLLYNERKKLIECEKELLVKYAEEGKFMKMLQGLYNIKQYGYRENVVRIMETVYNFDATGSENLVTEFFGWSQLQWSVINLEIGQLERDFELYDSKLESCELEDMLLFAREKLQFLFVLYDVNRYPDLIMEDYPDQWGTTYTEVELIFQEIDAVSNSDSSSETSELLRLESLDLPDDDVFPFQRNIGVDEVEIRKQRQDRRDKGRGFLLKSISHEDALDADDVEPESHEVEQEQEHNNTLNTSLEDVGSKVVPKELESLEKLNEESLKFFQRRTEQGKEKQSLLSRKKAVRKSSTEHRKLSSRKNSGVLPPDFSPLRNRKSSTSSIGSVTSLLNRSHISSENLFTGSVSSSESDSSARRQALFAESKVILVDGAEVHVADLSSSVGNIPFRRGPRQLSRNKRRPFESICIESSLV